MPSKYEIGKVYTAANGQKLRIVDTPELQVQCLEWSLHSATTEDQERPRFIEEAMEKALAENRMDPHRKAYHGPLPAPANEWDFTAALDTGYQLLYQGNRFGPSGLTAEQAKMLATGLNWGGATLFPGETQAAPVLKGRIVDTVA